MAGLQRFITYIYKYENDEKGQNAGFAKIEIRGTKCRVEVHVRNFSMEKPEATVYLFARKENIMQGVPVGTVAIAKGCGDVRYAFETGELLNFGLEMKDLEGIFIASEDDVYLASQWREGKIERGMFRVLEKNEGKDDSDLIEPKSRKQQPETNTPLEEAEQQSMPLQGGIRHQDAPAQGRGEQQSALQGGEPQTQTNRQQSQDTPKKQSIDGGVDAKQKPQMNSEAEEKSDRNVRATELPLENFFEENGWERIFQKLRLKLDIFFPFEGKEIECVKMQLNDLQEFPKKYWYIGNNSFLLHGFFNYRHIIFGEVRENGKKAYMIGVPGVFQNQERIMAAMFGFPEFQTAKTTEYKTGNFGYWYRII